MRLYFQFYFRFIETVYARDAETYQWFEAQLNEASFQQHPMGWKIRAETMYRSMAGGYYQLRSDFEQALAQARAGITLYSEMPFQKQQRVGSYKIFVRNALLFKGYLRNYDPEFQALLAELRTPYPTESEVERVINLRSGLIFEVSPYIATGNFKKAAALIPSLEDAIDGHPARYALAEYLLLIFNCFYIQFGLQDWKAASQSLNRLFQEAPPGFRQDLINIAKVLELVVLFEREAFDLLPYKIRSAYRFLRKNASAFGFERLILHFMRGKLLDATDATSLKVNFEQMHTQLAALFEDPYERNVLNYFDFLAWLSAKVTNRPFAEVMQAEASAKGYRCEWVDNQA
jgi:hypothetical protein